MKRLILFELIILFLATTFESDSPPGWFQQSIALGNKTITDIQFIDSSNGWAVTDWGPTFDTAYIFKTSNGGTNWNFQYRYPVSFTAINMVDNNTGYASGGTGFGRLFKTTNGGTNWNLIYTAGSLFNDLFFVNKDTGWVCDEDIAFGAGLLKTTNGGVNWVQQLNNTYRPVKLFFINKDTGWVGTSDANGRLFRTTNGGVNWNLQYTINTLFKTIYFINSKNGWIRAGATNGVQYTTDGGFTWSDAQGTLAGYDVRFVNDSVGFSGSVPYIARSTDGGKTWGYQMTPSNTYLSVFALKGDTLNGWAGIYNLIHTTDGGGPIIYTGIGINPNSGVVPSFNLKQNYPNPFNPSTNITFEVTRNSKISLKIFNMLGEEVDELIDFEKHNTGTYTVSYETDDDMPSGVYFYQITAWTEDKKEIFIDSKKMILLK